MKTYYLIYDKQLQRHVTTKKRWYHSILKPAIQGEMMADSRENAEHKFRLVDRFVNFRGES